ncbi:MAG: DUF3494 domain-containing protein [Harvfovirus sp.]|uniref:DUF3494 domain-containing protein n=1 Tax=Harvfovirus sp. TaxID=2487768 RepID=A0A3G5A197_9VIRU|nr:MAG: DUF3494 domain-containing protein [Harvfovirus sp.]
MTSPSLGKAAEFAVLAQTNVTDNGSSPSTIIGNLGISPPPPETLTGTPTVIGTIHKGDLLSEMAHDDANAAYNNLLSQGPGTPSPLDLSTLPQPILPGVYSTSSNGAIVNPITLDAQGNPAAAFIFIIPGLFLVFPNGSISIIGGGNACNIFFAVAGPAGISSSIGFKGNILSQNNISTMNSATIIPGRLLAIGGTVTLEKTIIDATSCPICFTLGTKILTPRGYIPIEKLVVGDKVTVHGKHLNKKITWIGKYSANNLSLKSKPVCIRKNAIADNVPHSDVYLSPNHGIYINKVLIQAKLLVNDITIFHDSAFHEVEYYHIELDHHSILNAQGLLTESFLDTGCRSSFQNPPTKKQRIKTWKKDGCAPIIATQTEAEPIRQMLLTRAMLNT